MTQTTTSPKLTSARVMARETWKPGARRTALGQLHRLESVFSKLPSLCEPLPGSQSDLSFSGRLAGLRCHSAGEWQDI